MCRHLRTEMTTESLALRPLQLDTLEALREALRQGHRRVLLYAPTGFGKSTGFGTPILMADGHVKAVQNVVVGDRLLGPDGRGRKVLSLGRGREAMFRVTPKKGDAFTCNASHILSLRKTPGTDGLMLADGRHIDAQADAVNVRLDTLLASSKTARHCLKGWRPAAFEFAEVPAVPLPVDAYWLGAWLGDGHMTGPSISKPSCNMTRWWIRHAEEIGASDVGL